MSQAYRIQPLPSVKGTLSDDDINYGQPKSGEGDEDGEEKPVITKKAAKKRIYNPEIVLIEPKARLNSNVSSPNDQPCGGVEKGKVHYIALPGGKSYF